MDRDFFSRVEGIYHEVLASPPESRLLVLDRSCSGDLELRREVEALLAARDVAANFLAPGNLLSHIAQLGLEAPQPGSTLGDYELLGTIGAGATGEVFRARDTRLGRDVALKILPAHLMHDRARVTRFQSEARAAAALNHPNIVTIYEVGRAGESWFIATELIEGVTLRQLLRNGKLPVEDARALAVQCAGALSEAHRAGIVHRDIKPENIMVRPDGVAKIVDFGVARIVKPRPEWPVDATQAGTVMGTPRYMSPEQARGEQPDARSDIFSLGAVLLEMVSGRPAFPGNSTAEVFAAVLGGDPNTAEAGPLSAVLSRALAKDAKARYRTAAEFRDDLLRIDPKQSRPLRLRIPGAFRRRLRARSSKIAAVVVLIAIAGIPTYERMVRREPLPAGELRIVPLTTFPGPKDFPSFSPDGTRIAFSWKGARNDVHHIYVMPVGQGEPVQLTFSRDDDIRPAWAPDGRSIAFERERTPGQVYASHDIYTIPPDGGSERKVAERCWWGASWSPDSKTIALANLPVEGQPQSGGIFLQSLESGKALKLTSQYPDHEPVFSPDGRSIAFVRNFEGLASEVFLIPAEGGRAKQLTRDHLHLDGITWTADGRELVFASRRSEADGSLWRLPIAGGPPRPVSATLRDAYHPSASRRDQRLAYTTDWIDTNIYLRTGQGWRNGAPGPFGEAIPVVTSSWTDHSPSFSPDGERVVFVSNRSGTLELWASHRDGSGAVRLTSMNAVSTGSPRWSPDGRRIVFDSWPTGNSAIYVLDAGGGAPKLLSAEVGGSWLPEWSADGEWIYFTCTRSGPREIWRVPARGGTPLQVTHGGAFRGLPSPDGKSIYYMKPGPQRDCCAIWSVPAAGGAEEPVPGLESAVTQRLWGCWGVLAQGIYFMTVDSSSQPTVRFLSFQTKRITTLFTLPKPPYDARLTLWSTPGLALSGDGRYAMSVQVEHAINDLMMIDELP